jgi:hypothetical protein
LHNPRPPNISFEPRKLKVIEYLIHLQDQDLIFQIENTILRSKNSKLQHPKPLTHEEVISRAKQSNEDFASRKVITQDELKSEIKNW